MRATLRNAIGSFGLVAVLLGADHLMQGSKVPSWILYDWLSSLHQRIVAPPPAIKEIVLVGIDSDTVARMEERWPYSRATFARVITHLKQSGARAVGLDFIFFGRSIPEEDHQLRSAMLEGGRVVLGASLNEQGGLRFSTFPGVPVMDLSGIVNKLQDADGVTRSAPTYLVNADPDRGFTRFFSWEMKLLEAGGLVDPDALEDQGNVLVIRPTQPGKAHTVPVDRVTKAFLIRFRARTAQFQRLSFQQVLAGDFDPSLVKGKFVLIGFLSEFFQDLHRTPIGWLPGLTLNANTLLTLATGDFGRPVPRLLGDGVVLVGLILLAVWVAEARLRRVLVRLALGLVGFFGLSYLLFAWGYVWNYARFPLGAVAIPWALRWLTARRGRLRKRTTGSPRNN